MKYKFAVALVTLSLSQGLYATEDLLDKNRQYSGAEAKLSSYKAIYQLDSGNPDTIKKAIRNINNLLDDPRLRGNIQVEIVTYSGGSDALLKTSPYEEDFRKLVTKGVLVVQCTNTLKEKKLDKNQFFDFVGFVPSANGELVIRASEGWVIIKP